MASAPQLNKIQDFLYEVPKSYRGDMRVPARFFADDYILEQTLGDRSLEQLVNTTTLPGVVRYALAMPDIHQGYGFPIGGVVATRMPDGVISPGGVGYDINCGVRLMATSLTAEDVRPELAKLAEAIDRRCPTGVGKGGTTKLSDSQLDELLVKGAQWSLAKGYAEPDDIEKTEERGRLRHADPSAVSKRARQRGRDQVGTVGAGNHFIEVDRVARIHDGEVARALGLFDGQVVTQVHCGSRGFGHQVCTDYVRAFQPGLSRHGIELPDRELVCAPFSSTEGQDYFKAMCCAANFAFANRQMLSHLVRLAFEDTFGARHADLRVSQVYDIAHNMAKLEKHEVDGQTIEVCVHRKGATRAFGPGFRELPEAYRPYGQPVLVPGSMGTASYVLCGTEGSMQQSFGSTCHGAGRVMSRAQAKRQVRGEQLRQELSTRGIAVRAGSMAGLAEEAPLAYKDVDHVVRVVEGAGIARIVARLEPLAVVKG
jgi:tRNA-splicing ligase RtcB